MSLWEIAHRWCGADPDTSDPHNLPIEVRDKLRQLGDATGCNLNLYTSEGEQVLGRYVPLGFTNLLFEHPQMKRLQKCVRERDYSKAVFDVLYVLKSEVERWCTLLDMPLPAFWFTAAEIADNEAYKIGLWGPVGADGFRTGPPRHQPADAGQSNAQIANAPAPTLRPSQEDRALAQAAAKEIWAQEGPLRIADMIQREEIQLGANAKHYTEETVRRWLSAVAPPEVKGRRGRPRKGSKH